MEKRLYRSRKERLLLGVCGGIAEYLALDPTLVRLVFILLIFATGPLLPIFYLVAALIIPEVPLVEKVVVKKDVGLEEKLENVVEDLVSGITGEETDKKEETDRKPLLPTKSRRSRTQELWGWILLGLGVTFFLSNLGWNFFPARIFVPAFLVFLGILLLFRWK